MVKTAWRWGPRPRTDPAAEPCSETRPGSRPWSDAFVCLFPRCMGAWTGLCALHGHVWRMYSERLPAQPTCCSCCGLAGAARSPSPPCEVRSPSLAPREGAVIQPLPETRVVADEGPRSPCRPHGCGNHREAQSHWDMGPGGQPSWLTHRPAHQDCGFDPQSVNIQDSTSECTAEWDNS